MNAMNFIYKMREGKNFILNEFSISLNELLSLTLFLFFPPILTLIMFKLPG